jgi:SRSO17 transposase
LIRLFTLPENTALLDLVRKAKWRWHIEQDYQQLKDELGLDHFESRSWIGWHRHVTMTMVAFGFLVPERLRGAQKGAHLRPLA